MDQHEVRMVTLTRDEVLHVAGDVVHDTGQWARLTGTDDQTHEIIKFRMPIGSFLEFFNGAQYRPASQLWVSNEMVLAVESNPEWDSPGTSPEEEDDQG